MTRPATPSPVRNLTIVGRLRFQLTVIWLIAVAIPGFYVYAGFITAESNRAIANSVIGAAVASMIGLVALRRVNAFPGARSYASILPSMAGSYGLTLVLFFGFRLAYSRSVSGASFVLAVILAFVLLYMAGRMIKPRFVVVPGGDVNSLLEITSAEWVEIQEIAAPVDSKSTLVADFHFDHSDQWERMLAKAAIAGQPVYHSKLLYESLTGRVTIEHLSENNFGSLVPNLAYTKIKRAIDIAACIIIAPFLIMFFIVIGTIIKMDSPGPVIFQQKRVGYRGQIFNMFKFRTMRSREASSDEDAARHDAMTRNDDDRITRIGRILRRTRLDELPQMVNVFRGEMSWIGPRPEAVPLSQWYEGEIPFYSYRHIIRPGISGWAQVHQGHVTDLDAIHTKLSYDFYYVRYFSAWLDIVILLRTISTMIGGFGAK